MTPTWRRFDLIFDGVAFFLAFTVHIAYGLLSFHATRILSPRISRIPPRAPGRRSASVGTYHIVATGISFSLYK
jgi:hypothetical protein